MILYHEKLGTELERYGIDLPLRDDRSHKLYDLLRKDFPELSDVDLESLEEVSREDLARVHGEEFLERWFCDEAFLLEMEKTYDCSLVIEGHHAPLKELRQSIHLQVAATYESVKRALKDSFCFYLGGGMHHARKDFGSGFCPLNDIMIALKKAQANNLIKKALVVDIDAHHGDGTSELSYDDDTIKTLSIHMAKGWPFECELEVVPSDVDIPIGRGEEATYLQKLAEGLAKFSKKDFDVVVVVAGADPFEGDELLSAQALKLSREQMLARDLLVYKWCQENTYPQTWLMAGGYGEEAPGIYSQFILKVLHLMG